MIGNNMKLSIINNDVFQSLDSDYDTIVVICRHDTFIERCREAFSKLNVNPSLVRLNIFRLKNTTIKLILLHL